MHFDNAKLACLRRRAAYVITEPLQKEAIRRRGCRIADRRGRIDRTAGISHFLELCDMDEVLPVAAFEPEAAHGLANLGCARKSSARVEVCSGVEILTHSYKSGVPTRSHRFETSRRYAWRGSGL